MPKYKIRVVLDVNGDFSEAIHEIEIESANMEPKTAVDLAKSALRRLYQDDRPMTPKEYGYDRLRSINERQSALLLEYQEEALELRRALEMKELPRPR